MLSTNTPSAVPSTSSGTYRSAAGAIEYTFLNDYMFHIVFQDESTLAGLICALLRLKPEQIRSIIVTNPIEPGDSILGKTFILDIHIILNDFYHINLELQVVDEDNWPERSLSYLCRTFDSLYKGERYKDARAAIHIGILDFTLFPDHPEFYASHKLMNEKTYHVYSDKFQLNVLDLNQIELATDEDKAYGLDHWAALFRATTWEEIKMLAEKDPQIDDAAQRFYEASVDFSIRENCRARREQEIRERQAQELKVKYNTLKDDYGTLQDENNAQKDKIVSLQDEIDSLRARLSKYES